MNKTTRWPSWSICWSRPAVGTDVKLPNGLVVRVVAHDTRDPLVVMLSIVGQRDYHTLMVLE